MERLPSEIVLRPRFKLLLQESKERSLCNFIEFQRSPYIVKRLDDHIFIKFKREHAHFWSPQLHLEFTEENHHTCEVHGLFGPNPTLWTFFMFLHFGVATLFIILGIWAYSNASLGRPYQLQLGAMAFMVLVWVVLYLFGRLGKRRGRPQMNELHQFMKEAIGQ
ncbi:MAG TPA: hypothetical protein VKN36_16685 [Eudoraea sp.]|nr:hypothetical protein [Eudoraea sp.]